MSQTATLILTHGQIRTLDRANPWRKPWPSPMEKFSRPEATIEVVTFAAEGTQIVDLKGRR